MEAEVSKASLVHTHEWLLGTHCHQLDFHTNREIKEKNP